MESSFYSDVILLQAKIKAPKSQHNNFGNYKYRSCEDILEAFKLVCAEHNLKLFLTLRDEMILIGERYYLKAIASLSNGVQSITVEGYAREALTKKGMDDAQVTGAVSSYARKYALSGLFCLDDSKDADATNDHEKDKKEKENFRQKKESAVPQDPMMGNRKNYVISENQVKRLFAIISKSEGWTPDKAHAVIKKYWKLESFKELNKDRYDWLCKQIQESLSPEKLLG